MRVILTDSAAPNVLASAHYKQESILCYSVRHRIAQLDSALRICVYVLNLQPAHRRSLQLKAPWCLASRNTLPQQRSIS